jgi:hypothetical protein
VIASKPNRGSTLTSDSVGTGDERAQTSSSLINLILRSGLKHSKRLGSKDSSLPPSITMAFAYGQADTLRIQLNRPAGEMVLAM